MYMSFTITDFFRAIRGRGPKAIVPVHAAYQGVAIPIHSAGEKGDRSRIVEEARGQNLHRGTAIVPPPGAVPPQGAGEDWKGGRRGLARGKRGRSSRKRRAGEFQFKEVLKSKSDSLFHCNGNLTVEKIIHCIYSSMITLIVNKCNQLNMHA